MDKRKVTRPAWMLTGALLSEVANMDQPFWVFVLFALAMGFFLNWVDPD